MKAIETEYKKQIGLEVPDLWSRIEAGVDEYEKSKTATVEVTKTEKKNDNVIKFERRKTIVTISRIAGAVAAIALVATVAITFGNRVSIGAVEEMSSDRPEKVVAKDDISYDADFDTGEVMAAADVDEMEYSAEEIWRNDAETEESVMDVGGYEQYNEAKLLASSIKCSEADADAMVNTIRTCGIENITKIQKMEPMEIAIGEYILIDIDLEQANLLRIRDDAGREYCICIEKEDDTYVLKFIVEDKEGGEILYIYKQ